MQLSSRMFSNYLLGHNLPRWHLVEVNISSVLEAATCHPAICPVDFESRSCTPSHRFRTYFNSFIIHNRAIRLLYDSTMAYTSRMGVVGQRAAKTRTEGVAREVGKDEEARNLEDKE